MPQPPPATSMIKSKIRYHSCFLSIRQIFNFFIFSLRQNFVLEKIYLREKSRLGQKNLNGPIFDFMDFLALLGDFRFWILLNYWKFPDKLVPYETYIISEENLEVILFARKYLKI